MVMHFVRKAESPQFKYGKVLWETQNDYWKCISRSISAKWRLKRECNSLTYYFVDVLFEVAKH